MKKRVLAFLMCLCLCMSLLPMAAMADGPQPATADFNVVLSVTLPEGYTGDSRVVTRKNIDASGNIVDFGDGKTYENGDVIAIKAGEWALFGFADIADHAGVWYHYASMNGGRVAVVDAPADGSDYTLCLGYNNTSGLRLGFMGSANINPGDNFGAGGLGSHPVGVYVDGVATSSFTVTSSDESVCTVTPDGTYITVTNVGYGTSVLTVTAGGYTEQFNWCCDPGPGEGEGDDSGDGGDDSGTGGQNGFTVTPTFNYPDGVTSGGAIRVLNADGSTTDYTDGEVVSMAAGETCRFIVLPLEDGTEGFWESMSGAMPGEETIDGVTYTTIAGQDTTVEITYGIPGTGGDDGPGPVSEDFDVVINVELPEGYEGDGKVVTRKARENGDGPLVDFGDGAVYGDGDTVSVKAGEWAIFGAAAIDGYAVEYGVENAGSNGTMGEGPESSVRYAVIESVDYGDRPVELVVRYVSTAGITLNWYDSIICPDSGFGVGGLDVTETLRVLYDGEQVSDFTVTNENDDVCTVEKDGANVLITSVGYGNSNITVTANGETATFTWCCDPGPSGDTVTVTVNYADGFALDRIGGVEIYDEDGNYLETCHGGELPVDEGHRLIVRVVEIEGADYSSSWRYCSDVEINGEMYRALDAGGSVEIEYYDRGQVGDPGITINHLGSDSFIPAGADISRERGFYEMEVRLDGEVIGEFDAYSSDESVCFVRNENGILAIECFGGGRCIITIEHNGIVAEYNWICDESIYQGISLAPEEALDGAIPAGARFGMPVWGEYRYKVRLDTFFVGDFTVTSDNPDLCEVSNKDGWLVVNSKGYGETPIHITVDGTTVDFTWVCMEPAMSVKPPEAGAPKTDAALNGGSTVVSDITEDGNGSVLVISSTIGNETSNIVVHTDNMEAIEEALEDENVTVGVVFGSMDINPEDISEPDLDAADEYAAGLIDEEKGERITALTLVDIFAELATVYPDRPGERLGAITEMDEEIEFTMAVKKDALRELGRDIRHLTVIHVHNGEAYTAWEYSEDYYYEETEDSYILHFEVNRFSPFILAYDWVIGDIDGDDKPADTTDLIRMMKYIAGEDVTVVADSVDVNGDGRGDILDVIRLMRAISGEDVELS